MFYRLTTSQTVGYGIRWGQLLVGITKRQNKTGSSKKILTNDQKFNSKPNT